ncbi:hypothetical protein YQE_11819, partial [Dendroctonus ponderosae]
MADVLVEVEQGKLQGTTGHDYYGGKFFKFLGVPYAKAPIGDLRFKAPQPPEPWTGVKNATKEGAECPSADMFFSFYVGQEDNCLNLNVYTKELPKEDKRVKKAVMVWIHGGAFTCGSNRSFMYGPEYLMTQDIVLVAINYRLGILGFASFKDPSLGIPGNAGLKDMREALRWVQKNVGRFGGDPDNVTIFGESAGGASVHYLTLAPSTQGLFHKAIVQSGSALNNWSWGKNNAPEIAKCLGYKETEENKIVEKLRKESAKAIVQSQRKLKEASNERQFQHDVFASGKIRPWGPVVEPESPDAILTEHPSKIMQSQGGHKIPLIIGYNSGEGIFFELVRRTVPGVGIPKHLEHEIPYELGLVKGSERSKQMAERLKKAYFGDKECHEDIDQMYKLKGDTCFIHPIQRTLKLQAKHSHQPVYAYRMSLVSSLNYFHTFAMTKHFKTTMFCSLLSMASVKFLPSAKESVLNMLNKVPKREMNGVVHADDLLYLFPTFFTPPIQRGSTEDRYIQRFVKMWTNFAIHGEPTPHHDEALDHVKWKPVSHENVEFLDIGHKLNMIENVDGDRMDIWDDIYKNHLTV